VSRGGTADGRQHVVTHLSDPVPAGSRSGVRSGLNVLGSGATTHYTRLPASQHNL
jgi:hypothetical protein